VGEQMKRSNGSLVLWTSIAMILAATSMAGAGPGYAQTSSAAHASPAPSQDKTATAPADSSDYVSSEPGWRSLTKRSPKSLAWLEKQLQDSSPASDGNG